MAIFGNPGRRLNVDSYKVGPSIPLPRTNSSPLNMMVFNRNLLFQGSNFRCYVSFREGKW